MFEELRSRKLIVAIIAAAVIVVNDVSGRLLSEEALYSILGILGTYILGQGISDHGSQGAAKAAERAVKQGEDVSQAVQEALGARTSRISIMPSEGPDWGDTSEEDEEDKRRELHG